MAPVAALFAFLILMAQESPPPAPDATPPPPESQPATRPSSSLRPPEQAQNLLRLLRRDDRPRAIQPSVIADGQRSPAVGADGLPLLPDGTSIVERPARFLRDDEQPVLELRVGADDTSNRRLPVLPNQHLEILEAEVEAGFTSFVISADVTRYRGANYLLIRKVLRRMDDGNVSP